MSEIVQKAESYVSDLLTNELNPKFLYHNLRHTQRVVKSTKLLIDHYGLTAERSEVLTLAAWFHDTGYTTGVEAHEKNSCKICEKFLKEHKYNSDRMAEVLQLIMATEKDHKPEGLEEEILRDADSSHLGQKSYIATSDFLREELSMLGIADYSASEWREENVKMFRVKHRFYTDYAKENWQPIKDKNLRKLIKAREDEQQLAKKEALKVKLKNESPDRGIQTLFRVTLRNHLTLSDIADTKANILLSVNAIIISLALSNLIPKLDNPSNTYLIWPTLVFILFSIASMILAVLATRPNVTSGQFSKEDVRNKKVNILFFGNFHKMGIDDYEWAIDEMLKDRDYIYSSLAKDLYYLGIVLNRKYSILRWTYAIFIIGMVVSVIAFGIAFRYFGPDRMTF